MVISYCTAPRCRQSAPQYARTIPPDFDRRAGSEIRRRTEAAARRVVTIDNQVDALLDDRLTASCRYRLTVSTAIVGTLPSASGAHVPDTRTVIEHFHLVSRKVITSPGSNIALEFPYIDEVAYSIRPASRLLLSVVEQASLWESINIVVEVTERPTRNRDRHPPIDNENVFGRDVTFTDQLADLDL